jgi:hypothetical protein
MSDRYSVVQVNGALVPSPIPTRRVVPLDIFPVTLLDNMTVVKSYLAKYQGEFGAGSLILKHETILTAGSSKSGYRPAATA